MAPDNRQDARLPLTLSGPVSAATPSATPAAAPAAAGVGRPAVPPALTFRPGSFDDAAQAVRQARQEGLPVVTRGGGSRSRWLPGPGQPYALVDLSDLAGPPDLYAANLTVTAPAGLTIAALDTALASSGLYFPADVAGSRTVGGLLAAGGRYPGRSGRGALRDWVLGLMVVTADGALLRLGGQTLKNVAGYDLVKLMAGSRGTLGLILEATLRLFPRPVAARTLRLFTPVPPPAAALTGAAAAEWLATPGGPPQLLVRVEGRPEQVERRVAALQASLPGAEVLDEPAAATAWATWYDLQPRSAAALGEGWVRLRIAVPPAAAAGSGGSPLLAAVTELLGPWPDGSGPAAGVGGQTLAGSPVTGLFTLWTSAPPALLAQLRARVAALGGLLWVEAAPAETLAHLPARPPRPQDALEARLREALAPGPAFNPHL